MAERETTGDSGHSATPSPGKAEGNKSSGQSLCLAGDVRSIGKPSAPASEGNVAFVSRMASPTNPKPSKTQASAGAPYALSPLD